ncbi:putative ATP-dependent RNA helicase TDRD12 [Scomber japonicus]|uniref:putative ATP-dependent RNA helicase TDRD12 n=1 Tax=Scomber japonicus TaxID=13676 RepID=UPI002304FAB5|nr:putative ATP-dependent RNA helicase TDRD12 [Scomber japonicus]
MLKISILKVENPSCLWGRVVRGPGGDEETVEQYDNLLAQMNLFYHDVTQDLRKLKPTSLDEGQVCVVYWSVMKSWCRAVVESIIMDSVSCQARCLLVDHGERLVVASDQIRIAMQSFLQLPFWVRRFHLAGIKPTTLRVSVYEEKAELIPSSQWDSSATLYLHNLLQASTQTEAVLLESESDSVSIELYLMVGKIKICANDDLVAKKFAYYGKESADSGGMDAVDRCPIMLSSSLLGQTGSTTSVKLKAQSPLRPVTSESAAADGAGDSVTAPSTAEVSSSAHRLTVGTAVNIHTSSPLTSGLLETCEGGSRSKVTEGPLFPGSRSKNGSEGAAAESDSSEDTDSSLAAALTKNLSLFKFLRFLNPGSNYQQAAPPVSQKEEVEVCQPEETTAASSSLPAQEVLTHNSEPVTQDQQVFLHMSSSRSEESGPAETEKMMNEEHWACSRLLEWLNPEPLNPNPDAEEDLVVPSDPRRSGILVHSALPVEPCTSLDDAPITDGLRWVLRRKLYCAPFPADCHSWPAVARGCNAVIVSQNADQPLSYLAPLLTHITLNSIFTTLTSSAGPVAVLLCPGWEKVQTVFDLLEETRLIQTLHPAIALLGVGKDEPKSVRIPKNCLLLVTTPFSLVRLLSCHCFLFLRMYHLILDEADQLFTLAPDQMATILQHFQKVTSSEEKALCPQQLVAVAKRWTSHMEGLLTNHMPYPSVVMTVPEEAALYGNVQQVILMTPENNKISVLLTALDFNPEVGQKTVIVTNSADEVDDVFKAVSNKSAFCLKTHEGLTHQFDFVAQQWRKDIGPGTHVILVTTNECLRCLGIRDATCVVHYGFPTSPKLFGSRLFFMADNFRNLSERVSSQDQTQSCPHVTRSVLLISERNARHVVGVLRYLGRTNAPLPPELLSFAQGVYVAREDQKTNRPLCSYLKSFGVCRDSSVCPDRHRFIPILDQSDLPASGVIEVVPLYIKTASVFYGRIVRKEDGGFDSMAAQMASYYADKKIGATKLQEGGLYAVQEDDVFHRVKVLCVPDVRDRLFYCVFVRFIDIGKEEEVKSHQILQLPEQFHSLPDQAIEIIVCRVKPVDAEIDWHPKVTRAVSQKIRGLQHRARAVLSLGQTVFVDPMVRVTQVPGMKTLINEYNVQSEILNTGMGALNPEHLDLLKTLCQDGAAGCTLVHVDRRSDCGSASLEVRIKAEEEVLAEAFRAAEIKKLAAPDPPRPKTYEPLSPVSILNRFLIPATPAPEVQTVPAHDQKSDIVEQRSIQTAGLSFHPQVRWYQTSDSVVVTVKLSNPQSQRCDFYPDRVVYSGNVNGRSYRADLKLQGNIIADRCCWEMKSNEPVLKLVKQQQGYWEKLLNNKNIFVSYDMDHFEEDEDTTPNGRLFLGNTGEDNWYVNSESGSESD